MKVEITILSAPIGVVVANTSQMVVCQLGGVGTLVVHNYYGEGTGGYVLTEADKAEIAALAAYDDTEIRALIDQRAQELGDYIGQNLSAFAQQISETDQRSRQNASAIQSINTAMLQIPEIEETAAQNSQSISTINGTIGDIATILDALNGEVI